ncbi:MAG TPA: ribonuclease P protein component [Ilumatobacter sp.]|nr:ribonuclease P protein component [Ilumatobacter sp.]
MILRVRDRQSFQRLSRDGTRIRRASLWCIWCPNPDSSGLAVAFAIGRALAPAVTRNRLRRRLRAVLRELDRAEPLPPCLLLIGATTRTLELTFEQLRAELIAMVRQVREQFPSNDPTPVCRA